MPVLLRLCSQMILNLEYEYEEELLLLAEYIVKSGIYDETLLRYLVKHFEGPVEKPETVETGHGLWVDCYHVKKRSWCIVCLPGAILPRG